MIDNNLQLTTEQLLTILNNTNDIFKTDWSHTYQLTLETNTDISEDRAENNIELWYF